MKALLFSFAAAAMVAVPSHAAAPETRQVKVAHDDLNLTSESGQKALERRLTKAARDVCDMDMQSTGFRLQASAQNACFRKAHAEAMRQFAALVEDNLRGG